MEFINDSKIEIKELELEIYPFYININNKYQKSLNFKFYKQKISNFINNVIKNKTNLSNNNIIITYVSRNKKMNVFTKGAFKKISNKQYLLIKDNKKIFIFLNNFQQLIKNFSKYSGKEIIIVDSTPFSYKKFKSKLRYLLNLSLLLDNRIYFIKPKGIYENLIFEGGPTIINSGKIISINIFGNSSNNSITDKNFEIKLIHDALIFGIKNFFKENNFEKAIIGISGGIDSAVVAYLACKALGNSNVYGLILPSKFTPKNSLEDAINLCKNLQINYSVININNIYDTISSELSNFFPITNVDITLENLQARIRMLLLMAFSNKFKYCLLNTSNKSEIATGYGTLYGDMSGALSVIGDLYKTQIYEIANYINSINYVIPNSIIQKEPSAELNYNQKDTNTLPPYHLLDKILYLLIEKNKKLKKIIKLGFDKEIVLKTYNLLKKSKFKLKYLPPILKVSNKTFNYDL